MAENKPVDPAKPVYQIDWGTMPPGNMWFGGSWSERKMESTKKQVEIAQYAADLKTGSKMILYGIVIAIACIILHFSTSSSHIIAGQIAKFFEWGIVAGGLLIVGGCWYKKAIELQSGIAMAGIILAGLVLAQENIRSWSISHLFKWRPKRPAKREPRSQDSVSIEDCEFVCDTQRDDQDWGIHRPK